MLPRIAYWCARHTITVYVMVSVRTQTMDLSTIPIDVGPTFLLDWLSVTH